MPPRVPQDQIDRLNAETSLVRVIEAAGVELARVGADHEGRCPFCDEEASLVVAAAANTWSCTACGDGRVSTTSAPQELASQWLTATAESSFSSLPGSVSAESWENS